MSIEICIPDIGDKEAEVIEIMVKVGDTVSAEQSIITIEGDKALTEIPAPFSGFVKEIKIAIGDKVKTGSTIMIFEKMNLYSKSPSFSKQSQFINTTNKFIKNNEYEHATPLIRKLAREFCINLSNIKSTGRKNRILREDVYNYIKKAIKLIEEKKVSNNQLSNILSTHSENNSNNLNKVKEIKLNRIQKISGDNLSRNWVTIPHVTLMDDIDITEVEDFRKQQNKELEKEQRSIKITILIFFIKAVARALEKMPRLNSSISENSNKIYLKKYINIGIAIDTQKGLFVPVIKEANKKGIIELAHELSLLSNKAHSNTLTEFDVNDGCFTISNLGGIGTSSFTPIINAPETAILGLSRSLIKPIWNYDKFIPKLILPISLSFDHRVIDGADGARFINIIKQLINDIRQIIM
ncbi:Dihydrolipoyllysine-residue acetyltransferase component of pyruvate dehydrogenase complex [Candidatus Providencia siddallii]|uniref:Dihydrolipoamide acetyltransferase component of pyruvate dehydrogenase complex n=1 Tax=Candidatus Providencia siddallii TaxID=1715285 RepID=A0A0M6W6J6_9GAMM|nr:Dihydrolipoyllysine-residue acetyltransferase component of pyruvate dehydrogenase complex [Candidatus Providencia siddallii]